MVAAAILDFVGIEFWQQNGLWIMVFSPYVKFCANKCHSDRDIAIKPISKMAAAAILDFLRSDEVNSVSGMLFLVSVLNFV